MTDSTLCRLEGCHCHNYSLGYCRIHYERFRRHGDPSVVLVKMTPRGTIGPWLNTHANYEGNECLTWPFGRQTDGRPGGPSRPTITMCTLAHGPRPTKYHQVAHSCGKAHEGCINPKHLRWATRKENEADKLIHGTRRFGIDHPLSKLKKEDVPVIHQMLKLGCTQRRVAEHFGVSTSTIQSLARGITWRQVA